MIHQWKVNRFLWNLLALVALWVSLDGWLRPSLYDKVVTKSLMPGILAQDIMTALLAIFLMFFANFTKEKEYKKHLLIFGILGYFFYTYMMYATERIYNGSYFTYLLLAGLSFYSLVFGLVSLRFKPGMKLTVSPRLHGVSLFFTLVIPGIFIPKWTGQLISLIGSANRIEYLYSIYILDLVFVMPAFLIVAFLNWKEYLLGRLLTPVLFIKGFTVLFPLVIAEYLKPIYGQVMNRGEMSFYLVLSLLFLMLTVFYLRGLRELGYTKGLIE